MKSFTTANLLLIIASAALAVPHMRFVEDVDADEGSGLNPVQTTTEEPKTNAPTTSPTSTTLSTTSPTTTTSGAPAGVTLAGALLAMLALLL
ncbi:hypothetical protein PRIPAC_71390 [Pristionchus pacificus]|uniref:Uncharacterized protein n=1 Tax=Pristionchus pacificus TaxID=54126 RepID=A0A2A6CFN2_PRIPA|nr:hypothetical protein PRIPAC_71390 [Pristionchus pacificus]|eukprot:PDM76821.1 hypothetical protein PRIPAC_42216 [Pristionchus pacificus]